VSVVDGSAFFAISPSNSLQKSSAIQKISVTLLSVIMIQHLLFVTSKLLNISDITKKIGSFFKLPIQLFYGVPYPELALKREIMGRTLTKFLDNGGVAVRFLGADIGIGRENV
jgi:hypothetical protein